LEIIKGDDGMKMRWLKQIPSMVLVVMLTLVVVQGLMFGPVAQSEGGGKLEGTWLMESTLVNCATGDPLPIPGNPFPSLHTYMRGGTALDSGASPPRSPGGTRTAAHGIWERTGAQTFRERFHSFSFDAEGQHVLTVEVTIERTLIQGEHAEEDEIIGVGSAKFFTLTGDPAGEGCARDTGQRVTFQE
jgi:hypothetical protein